MPRKTTYPTRGMTLDEAEELAQKIYNNGSRLKRSTFAELINMKESGGAFLAKISSLKKFGLIDVKNEQIILTRLAKGIILTKDIDTKLNLLFKSFKKVDLFKDLLNKFRAVGRINLDELDKNLQLEFGVNQNYTSAVKKSFTKSLNSLGILIIETGELDFSNVIDEDYEEESVDFESYREIKEQKISDKIGNDYNNDIFDLIIYLASLLDPMDTPIEEISRVIDKYDELSHIKYPFELEKENINKKSISQSKLKILLKALRQDLTR